MPFADGHFASVVSNCVFEHIPEIDRTIGEIARVLRPGGTFACTVIGDRFSELSDRRRRMAALGLAGAHRAYLDWYNRNAAHFHFDSPAALDRAVSTARASP